MFQEGKKGKTMNGKIENLSNSEYHSETEHISSTKLKLFPGEVPTFNGLKYHDIVETKEMKIGTAIHAATLEPDLFKNDYVLSEKFDLRTKAGKAGKILFKHAHQSKIIIDLNEMEVIENCRDSLMRNPIFKEFHNQGEKEVSFFLDLDGMKQKVRTDLLTPEFIVDIKTIDKLGNFKNSLVKFKYHLSEAMYTRIVSEFMGQEYKFLFAVVERTPPYACVIYESSEDIKNAGKKLYGSALKSYKSCLLDGFNRIETLEFPYWYDSSLNQGIEDEEITDPFGLEEETRI